MADDIRMPGEDPAETPEPPETEQPEVTARGRKKITKPEPAPVASLPRQQDIDATKIARAVLTTDGYVVPAKAAAPAAR